VDVKVASVFTAAGGVATKQSPYVVLKIGSDCKESAVCKGESLKTSPDAIFPTLYPAVLGILTVASYAGGDRNPTWNERFQFHVEKGTELQVEVGIFTWIAFSRCCSGWNDTVALADQQKVYTTCRNTIPRHSTHQPNEAN